MRHLIQFIESFANPYLSLVLDFQDREVTVFIKEGNKLYRNWTFEEFCHPMNQDEIEGVFLWEPPPPTDDYEEHRDKELEERG